jgi:hypothetical protein
MEVTLKGRNQTDMGEVMSMMRCYLKIRKSMIHGKLVEEFWRSVTYTIAPGLFNVANIPRLA